MKNSIDLSRVKAILFDFGGTLDNDGLPWKDHFHPFYKKRGVRWEMADYERHFRAADDFLTSKTLSNTKYRAMLEMQVGLVFKNAGLEEPDLVKRIARDFEKSSFKTLRRNRVLLAKLAKRYKLGIVSNFYGNLPVLCREIRYSPLFGAIIDSSCVGMEKPSPEIFKAALKNLNVNAKEAVFVGDNPFRDIAPAKKLGMQRIWINTLNVKRKALHRDDVVIQSLTELEKILLPKKRQRPRTGPLRRKSR